MDETFSEILPGLDSLEEILASWRERIGDPTLAENLRRQLTDLEALRFHLRGETNAPPIVALLGGTGTGKSTLVNRLLGGDFSAASFRRTYTSGPIAFHHESESLPLGWSGLPHQQASSQAFPLKGEAGTLLLAPIPSEPLRTSTLVDTPDVDGDADAHYEQAERIFRWSQAVVFLATPEKYQMTELIPFHRLAKRYGIPTLFVMNKSESVEAVDDFREQLRKRGWEEARLFAIPRDDSTHEPPEEMGLERLRRVLHDVGAEVAAVAQAGRGARKRVEDSLKRTHDQIIEPLFEDARTVEGLKDALLAFVTPSPHMDVSPLTAELQERMRAKSILYLIGPKRILDRARQVSSTVFERVTSPGAWFSRKPGAGKKSQEGETIEVAALPDFHALAVDQFRIGAARIRDILESSERVRIWTAAAREEDCAIWIDPEEAGKIVDEEIENLNRWLKDHWDAAPRDTQAVLNFLNRIPGGKKVIEWSEASPYLLAAVVAASGALFGPIDLLVIGGYSLATWLGERLSNEVTARVRATNRTLYRRFEELMHEQVRLQIEWLSSRAPEEDSLHDAAEEIERLAARIESD